MTNEEFIQRRKHVRVDVDIPIVLIWPKKPLSEDTFTINLSGGGLRCLTDNMAVQLNEALKVQLALPGYIETQGFSAKVAFTQPHSTLHNKMIIGLQFQYVSPKIEQSIIQFCFQTEILNRRDKSSWSL